MGYTVQRVEFQEACQKYQEYEYALLYMMSELILSKTSELTSIDWEECLEARFFDLDKELHIFEDDGEHTAVEVVEQTQEECLVKKYQLANKFRGIGKAVCIKEYLSYDEDGQAYVALTRLSGIE